MLMSLGPLIKLISKIDSLDRLKKGRVYPAKQRDNILEYVDENGISTTMLRSKVCRYFYLCDCGAWAGAHSAHCSIYRKDNADV
jgi:hypothetical protein